jgi:hypothetical protein
LPQTCRTLRDEKYLCGKMSRGFSGDAVKRMCICGERKRRDGVRCAGSGRFRVKGQSVKYPPHSAWGVRDGCILELLNNRDLPPPS